MNNLKCQAFPCSCFGAKATHEITYADGSVRPISERCATQHLITGFHIEPIKEAPTPLLTAAEVAAVEEGISALQFSIVNSYTDYEKAIY